MVVSLVSICFFFISSRLLDANCSNIFGHIPQNPKVWLKRIASRHSPGCSRNKKTPPKTAGSNPGEKYNDNEQLTNL